MTVNEFWLEPNKNLLQEPKIKIPTSCYKYQELKYVVIEE